MNVAVKNSYGQLITIPIRNAKFGKSNFNSDVTKLLDSEEGRNDDISSPSTVDKEIFFEMGSLDEGRLTDVAIYDAFNNQIQFLDSLDFGTSGNIDSFVAEEIEVFDNNNLLLDKSQEFLHSNHVEVIEEFELPNSLDLLNVEEQGNVDFVITGEISSPVCRLCAQRSENLIYIFGVATEQNDIVEKINNCLPITVKKTDNFSKMVCFSCLEKVDLIHNFHKIVSNAEATFAMSFLNNSEKLSVEERSVDSTIEESSRSENPVTLRKSEDEEDSNKNTINEDKVIEKNVNNDFTDDFNEDNINEDNDSKSNVNDTIIEDIKCRICDVKFNSKRKCFLHAASHSKSNHFPCCLCENIFETSEKWSKHYTDFHRERKISERRVSSYECTKCNKKFIDESRLKFHLQFHEPGAKPCYCEKCDKFVSSELVLYNHIGTVHMQSKEYCCKICGVRYRSQAKLTTHQRKHTNERPYKCRKCSKGFYSSDSCRKHEKIHLRNKSLQCNKCDKTFHQNHALSKHLLTHKASSTQSTICQVCKICSQILLDTSLSKSHIQACSGGLKKIEEQQLDAVYRCEFCQQCYSSIASAKSHSATHSGELPYVCTICNVSYATYNQVIAHKSAHRKSAQILRDMENTVTKFFFCQVCEKEFLNFTSMNLHRKSCLSNELWTCPCCAQVFTKKEDFSIHKNRRENVTRLICEDCNISFGNKCRFEIHKIDHKKKQDKKVFTCFHCRKKFQHKSHLSIHMRSHTGEKPFACSLCSKRYTIKADRDNHQKTHSGERPYKCKLCVKDFTNPTGLRIHMLNHSDIRAYKCTYCERTFKNANAKKIHVLIHTGEKPYQCKECDASFRRPADLTKHKKSH